MKRITSTLAIAVVAAAFSAACAQNNDGSKVMPTQKDVQQSQAQPSNENMDANAQRAHDRNTASTRANSSSSSAAVASSDVRDWSAIDKNQDNLISPEEMEASLKQNAPAAKAAPKR